MASVAELPAAATGTAWLTLPVSPPAWPAPSGLHMPSQTLGRHTVVSQRASMLAGQAMSRAKLRGLRGTQGASGIRPR